MNLAVIKQWFSLIFRGEIQLLYLCQAEIETFLTTVIPYQAEGVYIREAVYSPLLDTIQVVAQIPAPSYGNFRHNTAEQYVRVISQIIYILCRCLHAKGTVDITQLKDDPESNYYRQTNLRYQRLIRPNEPFVVTLGLSSVRRMAASGIWQIKVAVTDGPFSGEIDGVLVPGGTAALSDSELPQACYTIWQEIAQRFKKTVLRFATQRIRRRLSPEAAIFIPQPLSRHRRRGALFWNPLSQLHQPIAKLPFGAAAV